MTTTTTQAKELFNFIMINRCTHVSHVGAAWDWVANAVHARYPEITREEVHGWIRARNTDPTHRCWEHAR